MLCFNIVGVVGVAPVPAMAIIYFESPEVRGTPLSLLYKIIQRKKHHIHTHTHTTTPGLTNYLIPIAGKEKGLTTPTMLETPIFTTLDTYVIPYQMNPLRSA